MDELEQYIKENELSAENILGLVTDYDIYCEYIGIDLEVGVKYSSPLREGDDDPSFVIYPSRKDKNVFLFKDHATGQTGNVFKFLEYYLGLTKMNVFRQINSDLQLGLNGEKAKGDTFKPVIKERLKITREPVTIRVTSKKKYSKKFKDYWDRLDISLEMCSKYNVTDVDVIHFITKESHKFVTPSELCIAYQILGTYKIYQPFGDRYYKFRNNYPYGYVEGALQLDFKNDFCIITKSTKECMFFRQHFGWDAVAGTSENTLISDYFFSHTLSKYSKVFVWLDLDSPGIKAQNRYLEKYPGLIPIIADKYPEFKDPTDLYEEAKIQGWKDEALKYIHDLIYRR